MNYIINMHILLGFNILIIIIIIIIIITNNKIQYLYSALITRCSMTTYSTIIINLQIN